MDIPSIETFLVVARKQSFSQAAEALFLTQPAISKRIASLESELNYQLFDRIKKQVILTEAGRLFLPHAEHIMQQLKDGKNALAEIDTEISGELVMATSHHIGLHHLPPILERFVHQFPKVDLHLNFMESEMAYHAVSEANIELAVITLPNKASEHIATVKLWSDPLSFAINREHPLVKELDSCSGTLYLPQSRLHLLSEYPAILPESGTYTREILDNFLNQAGIVLQEKLSNNYLETIKMMVSVGLGWSFLPDTLIDQSMSRIKVAGFQAERSLGIVTHQSRTLSRASLKMIELLQQSLKI
jgi:DNA-binding transcriptional LysR family regulator